MAKTRSGHITRLDTTLMELCGFVLRRNNVASVSCHVFVLNTHFIKLTTDIKDKAETKDYFWATYVYTQGRSLLLELVSLSRTFLFNDQALSPLCASSKKNYTRSSVMWPLRYVI